MSSREERAPQRVGGEPDGTRFWHTWMKVMLVQTAVLLLLWALQARYSG